MVGTDAADCGGTGSGAKACAIDYRDVFEQTASLKRDGATDDPAPDDDKLRHWLARYSCPLAARRRLSLFDNLVPMKEILVTDSLFIADEHVEAMERAGFQVDRLDVPKASESELIDRIKGKSGYILGGVERVTEPVIAAADELEAIVFTGAGYKEFIPAHQAATDKGIAVGIAPGITQAVTEFTIGLILLMNRRMLELGRTGKKDFKTVRSIVDLPIGIVGMGRIGIAVARALKALGATNVAYFSRTRKPDVERELDISYMQLEDLLRRSAILTLHCSKDAGELIGKEELALMPDDAVLVNVAWNEAVDPHALRSELETGRVRAAFDAPPAADMGDLPLANWFTSNASTAFNTTQSIKLTSDMATETMINLLTAGDDPWLVNPEYRKNKG